MWYDWIAEEIGFNTLLISWGLFDKAPVWLAALELVLAAVGGYLLGSINPAIIISTKMFGKDIRGFGSGNAGLTNMLRVYGKKAAVLTLVGDMLKAALAIFVGAWLCGNGYFSTVNPIEGYTFRDSMEGAYLAGLFCVIGHIAPVYYKFKGGKGVLAAATMILLLDPYTFICLILIFAVIVLITRYVSMGSVIAAFFYPAITYITHTYVTHIPPGVFKMVFAFVCGLLVIFMHRENIKRVYHGKENKLSFGPKKKKKDERDEDEDESAHYTQ